jgi:hypothetical protein
MVSLHFSNKQCINSSLTFDAERLKVWENLKFKEKETTATCAFLEDSWPNPSEYLFRRLKLKIELRTLCPENFLIIGYTQASGFVRVPRH